jgi:hypothetical protein
MRFCIVFRPSAPRDATAAIVRAEIHRKKSVVYYLWLHSSWGDVDTTPGYKPKGSLSRGYPASDLKLREVR